MILILMGVTGSGKSELGRLLAKKTGIPFFDGDDYHPAENVEKMRNATPLNDQDRAPWLATLRKIIAEHLTANKHCIIACSALKHRYRRVLSEANPGIKFVHLKGTPELIAQRIKERVHRYMNPKLLASQFEALEEPEDAYVLDVARAPDQLVEELRNHFGI